MTISVAPNLANAAALAGVRVDERLIAGTRETQAYRVRVLVPNRAAGPAGYPVLMMLDGDTLLPEVLGHLAGEAQAEEPILVILVSHATQGDAAKQARVYDYTPGLPGNPRPADPRVSAWRNGGADDFLHFLDSSVMPWINGHYGTDTARMTFYGHSYGALCVLHALCTQALPMSRYVAASPSVWWQGRAIFDEVDVAA